VAIQPEDRVQQGLTKLEQHQTRQSATARVVALVALLEDTLTPLEWVSSWMREHTGSDDGTAEILTTATEAIHRARARLATSTSALELRAAILGNLAALESLCAWRRVHIPRRSGKWSEMDEKTLDAAAPQLAITTFEVLLEMNSRLIHALREAEELIAARLAQDNAECLARMRLALHDTAAVNRIYGANRQFFAELLEVCRAVVAAEEDGGISMADLWSHARDLARAAAAKADRSRFALGLELEAWSETEKLPHPGNPHEMLLRPELTRSQRRWLMDFSLTWDCAAEGS